MEKTRTELPNALTVDVEDWYHSILEIEPEDWPKYEDRVEPATDKLLTCLADCSVRATFFVLGHVAETHPGLVPRIVAAGHEIACHGYAHRLVYTLTPDEFRADLCRSMEILRSQTDQPIRGYRAAYWSITRRCSWALDIVAEEGLTYDSSIYPMSTRLYGIPEAPTAPYRISTPEGHQLLEFPPSVLSFPFGNVPFAGGIYLRLLPYCFVRRAMRHYTRGARPALVYIHPPEFDPEKPRLPMTFGNRVLHYVRLDAFRRKVPSLLKDFAFAPAGEILDRLAEKDQLQHWKLEHVSQAKDSASKANAGS